MFRPLNCKLEANLARLSLLATSLLLAGLFHYLFQQGMLAYEVRDMRGVAEVALFATAMFFVMYGNILYHVCLIGYYVRRAAHAPAERAELDTFHDGDAPSLTVLIPAYKEERNVNWQTMMSAALSEYPSKEVVLLIDDPYRPNALADIVKLEDTRLIPGELQALFDAPAEKYRAEQEAYHARVASGRSLWKNELEQLAHHYEEVAAWLENIADKSAAGREHAALPHSERFFIEAILLEPADKHRARAEELRAIVASNHAPRSEVIARHYARLVGFFIIRFSSFERKKYANLSHEANKAMNLNSYMTLIGKSWKEVVLDGDLHLVECAANEADFTVPHADYINTIDSDTVMLGEYSLRLIEWFERPENHRLAVIQSPVSSFPGAPKGLERTAGACIDIQYRTHQGYTHWGASFWVGANAMLRRTALEEIKEVKLENGHPVSIYIQDRTVIEDTESTIDLVHKGWKLANYPERMTFSANPPDFGALLIQRRRWSNGGLIILPKLFHYVWHAKKDRALAKEFFMRFHYLASTTTGVVAALLFFFYPFGDVFSSAFLPLSIVPFFMLHIRDLKNTGYRASDALRICAMNLMLVPIVTGGVLKSFQQMATGKKIPFGRTPKVPGRTAAPALYSAIALAMPIAFLAVAANQFMIGHTSRVAFALVNAGFMAYALVYFVGVKAALADTFGPVLARLRAVQPAEILPLFPGQPEAALLPVKQA